MFVYTVRTGDSLFAISQKFDVPVDTLRSVNGLAATNIVTGQALLVTSDVYTVQPGDSLWTISRMAYVPLSALRQANPGINPDQLSIGQKINLPTIERRVATHFSYSQLRTPALDQSVIANNAPYLTYIALFETHFNWNGDLSPLNDNAAVLAAWRGRVTPVLTVTNLTATGFNSALVQRVLNTPSVQQTLIDNMINMATSSGYGGINIDFEGVLPADRNAFVMFLQALKQRTQSANLNLSIAVPAKTNDDVPWVRGYDYAAIGAIVDQFFIMAYDWHYSGSEPGATAPIQLVRETLEFAASLMDRNKIIMGTPFYGYDWPIPFSAQNPGRAITYQAAIDLAMSEQVPINYSTTDQAAYFYYTDDSGQNRVVWFEDVRSLFAKAQLVYDSRIAGIGSWQINFPMAVYPWVFTHFFQIRKV
ncbi:glycosyl hydrolase family 18 protein [Sporolactobacillus terrae]|nr:glycosyl hydrolase family 18 protein [Sporolactobacillus terrae]QAA23716.1 LysM peptidoglycan-binding domain-containing protein [Sporolactobacillus terrae]QAA26688.1 LysM peptidoglycan-binding domain-containing protein [Sporolactobacillus terrae]UAK15756.1 LysM peptidoglycan-binding domain-containing protein [Sporolactobacillus terrae]BBO00245.1 putative sporulation-specific glycosylase YdhD [Sporolactobacillus terrae]